MMTAHVVAIIKPAAARTPDDVLEYSKGKLGECVVLGADDQGKPYIIGCDASGGTTGTLWLIEAVKLALLRGEITPYSKGDGNAR